MWSLLWSILVCKIPKFWEKAADLDNPSYFLESRHPEVTKNSHYVLSSEESQKMVTTHRLKKDWLLLLAKPEKYVFS